MEEIVVVDGKEYICKKHVFSQNDTIVGVVKGKSMLNIHEGLKVFFDINGKKTFKVGDVVLIPFSKTYK